MTWEDRLQTASYTSSTNVTQEFDFENVSEAFTNKGTAFNFPNAQGTYVQRSGYTGRQIPLSCFFSGSDYDLAADNFMLLLRISGVGKLKHPMYGTIDVVPLGEITRTDNLKSAAGQAIINVTFLQTTGLIFPTAQDDPESLVVASMQAHWESSSEEYQNNLSFDSVTETIDHRDRYLNSIEIANSDLKPLVNDTPLLSRYNAIFDSIVFGLDDLLDEPLTLGRQTLALINIPAYTHSVINAKLAAYNRLIDLYISALPPNKNELASTSLFSFGFVGGGILSVINTEFETQNDALNGAVYILGLFDKVNAWLDESLESLDSIDTGGAYFDIQNAVSICAGYLIQISFSLKQERTMVLTSNRSLVELVYELYGELDEQYDFFINSNNLTGDEIIELPAGKTIRYYV